jgi:hypothetical protein
MRTGYEHTSCLLSYGYRRLCLGEIELLMRFSDIMILGRMKSVRNSNESECDGGHTCKESAPVLAVHAASSSCIMFHCTKLTCFRLSLCH